MLDTDLIHVDEDEQPVWLTSAEPVKALSKLPKDQQDEFLKAKMDEVKFLLDAKTVAPILQAEIQPGCEIKPMKWILFIKLSPNTDPPIRFRARLVSASHLAELRHSLNRKRTYCCT